MRDVLRKVAPLLLLVGGLAIGARLCASQEKLAHVTIVYAVAEPAAWQELEVEIRRPESGEVAARFRTTMVTGEVRQRTRLAPGTYDAAVTLTAAGGERRDVTRTIDVRKDATIRVELP